MKIQHLIPILFLAAFCTVSAQTNIAPAESKSIKLDTNGIPFGTLGYPVGSYLTIEGPNPKWYEQYGKTDNSVLVDTVNGSKLAKPISIEAYFWHDTELPINNLHGMVLSTNYERFVFKGYEIMEVHGEPPAFEAAAKEPGWKPTPLTFGPQRPDWRLDYSFEVIFIISPKQDQH